MKYSPCDFGILPLGRLCQAALEQTQQAYQALEESQRFGYWLILFFFLYYNVCNCMMIEDIFSVGLPMILVTISKENKFVFLIFDVLCAVTKVHSNV